MVWKHEIAAQLLPTELPLRIVLRDDYDDGIQNATGNKAPVLVLVLVLVRETVASSRSTSTGETPEYDQKTALFS